MKVLISGGTGYIGKHIIDSFDRDEIYVLSRSREGNEGRIRYIKWAPPNRDWEKNLEKPDIIINLAGKSIGEGRWNERLKKELLESRLNSTRSLVEYANSAGVPIMVSASAVGYYGNRGDDVLTEESPPGNDFLANLAVKWEEEASKFNGHLIILRFGVVIGKNAPLLQNLLKAIKLRSAKRLGTGKQWYSWIHVDDIPNIIKFSIENKLQGPVNASSPNPMRNEDFMKILSTAYAKKQYFSLPTPILKMVLGELADYLVLSSQRAIPNKLISKGYRFQYASLEQAIQASL